MRRLVSVGGLTITTALVVGFGLTLGLWLFTAYDFTHRIAEVNRDAALITERYMRSQEALSAIRGEVLLGSVYVRDALLDPDRSAAEAYRVRLKDTYAAVDLALRKYEPIIGTASEHQRVVRLRQEVSEFQSTMLDVLKTDRGVWPTEPRRLLNERVVPRRAALLRVAEESQALNRAAFVAHQRAIAGTHEGLQDLIWQRLGVALALSFGIGFIAVLYSGRLEHRIRQQQRKDAQNTLDLQQLSAALIRAQEEERRTIARELHDEVGQALMALKVELSYARRAIVREDASRSLDEAESIADGALRVVRDLSQLFHPALLDDLGLAAAIDWYVQGFTKRYPIEVDLRIEGLEQRLPQHVEVAAFRIMQEALTNVARHSRATTCVLSLRRSRDRLVLTIEDDGVGLDLRERDRTGVQRGLGLIGIRERIAQLHGTFLIESSRDAGTKMKVDLPASEGSDAERPDESTALLGAPAVEVSSE